MEDLLKPYNNLDTYNLPDHDQSSSHEAKTAPQALVSWQGNFPLVHISASCSIILIID